jgi:hypothetical protein
MNGLEEIAKVASRYVDAKKKVTACMGLNFRQVCHACFHYADCINYSDYFDAWTVLERAVNADRTVDPTPEEK